MHQAKLGLDRDRTYYKHIQSSYIHEHAPHTLISAKEKRHRREREDIQMDEKKLDTSTVPNDEIGESSTVLHPA